MSRDPQKHRLYESERVFDTGVGVTHFRSVAQMESFVEKVVNSDWWAERSPVEEVKVFLGRKDASVAKAYPAGSSWRGVRQSTPFITIPPRWAATDITVIHELAHICVGSGQGHGPKYAARYLAMLEEFSGVLNARKLQAAFDEQQVEYLSGPVRSTRAVEAQASREHVMQAQEAAQAEQKRQDDQTFLALLARHSK